MLLGASMAPQTSHHVPKINNSLVSVPAFKFTDIEPPEIRLPQKSQSGEFEVPILFSNWVFSWPKKLLSF